MKQIIFIFIAINVCYSIGFCQKKLMHKDDCLNVEEKRYAYLTELDNLGIIRELYTNQQKEVLKIIATSNLLEMSKDSVNKLVNNLGVIKTKGAVLTKDYLSELQKSDYCSFMLYVISFERLLVNGLDLSFDYASNLPTRFNYVGFYDEGVEATRKENDALRDQHRLYRNFLLLKQCYEKYIIDVFYNSRQEKSFEFFVEEVLSSSKYQKHDVLTDILLSEYEYMSVNKLREDINNTRQ